MHRLAEGCADARIEGFHAGMHRNQRIADKAYRAKAGSSSPPLEAISPVLLCL
jgi:hypothetical protein